MQPQTAIVLFSGGLDSTTCLYWARAAFDNVIAVSFHYGQKHQSELNAAKLIAQKINVPHFVLTLDPTAFLHSALTDKNQAVPTFDSAKSGVPATYVPARNTLFLSYALALAETHKARHIVIGVSSVDYSGYPDCRADFIAAFETVANLGTVFGRQGDTLTIHTPLQKLSKAATLRLGKSLGVDYADTVSCYQADDLGAACGICDSCALRRQGFLDAGVADPTRYQVHNMHHIGPNTQSVEDGNSLFRKSTQTLTDKGSKSTALPKSTKNPKTDYPDTKHIMTKNNIWQTDMAQPSFDQNPPSSRQSTAAKNCDFPPGLDGITVQHVHSDPNGDTHTHKTTLPKLLKTHPNLVLFFYPKDGTPTCTDETRQFDQLQPDFDKLGFAVLGASKDSAKTHANFRSKNGFSIGLLSDPKTELCQSLDIIGDKILYGKPYRGIVRTTLIFKDGKLAQRFDKVKAKEHGAAVLAATAKLV